MSLQLKLRTHVGAPSLLPRLARPYHREPPPLCTVSLLVHSITRTTVQRNFRKCDPRRRNEHVSQDYTQSCRIRPGGLTTTTIRRPRLLTSHQPTISLTSYIRSRRPPTMLHRDRPTLAAVCKFLPRSAYISCKNMMSCLSAKKNNYRNHTQAS